MSVAELWRDQRQSVLARPVSQADFRRDGHLDPRPGPPTSPRLGPRCCSPLLMQSTGALANETSQELGGSCANTRDSDIVSTPSPPDTIGPCSGGATGGGELRTVLAGPPTISTQGNSTISRISGSSAARRSRATVSPG